MHRNPGLYLGLALLTLGVSAMTGRGAPKDDEVTTSIVRATAKMAAELRKDFKGKKIAISGIIAEPGASGGPGIIKDLTDALTNAGFEVGDQGADLTIGGSYYATEDGGTRIELDVKNKKRAVVARLTKTVYDETDRSRVTGPIVDLPPQGKQGKDEYREARTKAMGQAIQKPKFTIKGTELRTKADSPFGLEVLVKDEPVKISEKDGQPRVTLKEGDEYVIRLHNRSKDVIAAMVTIDGLSVFEFSNKRGKDGRPASEYWLLYPGEDPLEIKGWYRDDEGGDAFLVGRYSKAPKAPRRSQQTKDLSTITVSYAVAWEKGKEAPESEKQYESSYGDAGTFQGSKVKMPSKPVDVNVGKIRTVLSLRYDLPSK